MSAIWESITTCHPVLKAESAEELDFSPCNMEIALRASHTLPPNYTPFKVNCLGWKCID